MKILVLGHGDHGKDTFTTMLIGHTNMRFISSSEFALDRAVWPHLNQWYRCKEHCFNDRKWHRDLWRALIAQYNSPDKGRLCREMLVDRDIYVGMRAMNEYAVVRDLFNFIFYVHDARKPREPSMEINFDPQHMVMVDNSKSLEHLASEARRCANLVNYAAS